MVKVVDDETFDVRTVKVLICHDHETTVPQAIDGRVRFAMLQAEDLLDVLDLGVLLDLVVRSFTHIQQLTSQGKHTIRITANLA